MLFPLLEPFPSSEACVTSQVNNPSFPASAVGKSTEEVISAVEEPPEHAFWPMYRSG